MHWINRSSSFHNRGRNCGHELDGGALELGPAPSDLIVGRVCSMSAVLPQFSIFSTPPEPMLPRALLVTLRG